MGHGKRTRDGDEAQGQHAKRAATEPATGNSGAGGGAVSGAGGGARGDVTGLGAAIELMKQLDEVRKSEAYDPLNPNAQAEVEQAAAAVVSEPAAEKDKILKKTSSGWMECFDAAKQRNYWFNKKTGESAWSKPAAADTPTNTPASSAASQRAESQFTTGQRLFKQNLYKEAIEAFTKALDGHPDTHKVYSWRGVANDFLERHEAAFDDHHAAVIPGKFPVRYFNRGNKHLYFERHAEAEKDFLSCLKLDPKQDKAKAAVVKVQKLLRASRTGSGGAAATAAPGASGVPAAAGGSAAFDISARLQGVNAFGAVLGRTGSASTTPRHGGSFPAGMTCDDWSLGSPPAVQQQAGYAQAPPAQSPRQQAPPTHGFLRSDTDGPPCDEQLVNRLISLRVEAKKARDFTAADNIRDQLLAVGVELWDKHKSWNVKLRLSTAPPATIAGGGGYAPPQSAQQQKQQQQQQQQQPPPQQQVDTYAQVQAALEQVQRLQRQIAGGFGGGGDGPPGGGRYDHRDKPPRRDSRDSPSPSPRDLDRPGRGHDGAPRGDRRYSDEPRSDDRGRGRGRGGGRGRSPERRDDGRWREDDWRGPAPAPGPPRDDRGGGRGGGERRIDPRDDPPPRRDRHMDRGRDRDGPPRDLDRSGRGSYDGPPPGDRRRHSGGRGDDRDRGLPPRGGRRSPDRRDGDRRGPPPPERGGRDEGARDGPAGQRRHWMDPPAMQQQPHQQQHNQHQHQPSQQMMMQMPPQGGSGGPNLEAPLD